MTEIDAPKTLHPQARQEMESAFAVRLSKTDKTREGSRTRWALNLIRNALDRLEFLEEQDRMIRAEFGGKRSGLSTYEFLKETFEKLWAEDKQLERLAACVESRGMTIPPDIDKIASDIVKKSHSGEDDPDFEHYLDIATAIRDERERCAKIAESGSFQTVGDQRRAKCIAEKIRSSEAPE